MKRLNLYFEVIPTGGLAPTLESLQGWFAAGVTCVEVGSKLMVKKVDGSYAYAKIEALTRERLEIIQDLRELKSF